MAGSGRFSIISQLLLNYFPDISRSFPISHLFLLFLVYFTVISRFSIISHLFLKCFPNISQIFIIYPSHCLVKLWIYPLYLVEAGALKGHGATFATATNYLKSYEKGA